MLFSRIALIENTKVTALHRIELIEFIELIDAFIFIAVVNPPFRKPVSCLYFNEISVTKIFYGESVDGKIEAILFLLFTIPP